MMMSLDYQYCCVVVSLRVGAIALNLPILLASSLEFSLADVLTPQARDTFLAASFLFPPPTQICGNHPF